MFILCSKIFFLVHVRQKILYSKKVRNFKKKFDVPLKGLNSILEKCKELLQERSHKHLSFVEYHDVQNYVQIGH